MTAFYTLSSFLALGVVYTAFIHIKNNSEINKEINNNNDNNQ